MPLRGGTDACTSRNIRAFCRHTFLPVSLYLGINFPGAAEIRDPYAPASRPDQRSSLLLGEMEGDETQTRMRI
jgi:hypothetical protein